MRAREFLASSSRISAPGIPALLLVSLLLAVSACDAQQMDDFPPVTTETLQDAVGERSVNLIYVPAYTHALDQGGRVPLTTTLMIHNVSSREIVIHSVRYYDSAGRLVQSQLDEPRSLQALETFEILQEPSALGAGAGANFLVGWTGRSGPAPLVEALMVGHQGAGRLTFTSRGVEVGLEDVGSATDARPR
ncbi:MAG TPA: DUF3124 domain-containing protein [Alphaproteobacteria bacterium]|nr:DUF3124 domain-containing protein [Alphaproteobacteria bacterium]